MNSARASRGRQGPCGPQKLRRPGIHPCNNVTQPHRILLILKSDEVFGKDSTPKIRDLAQQNSSPILASSDS